MMRTWRVLRGPAEEAIRPSLVACAAPYLLFAVVAIAFVFPALRIGGPFGATDMIWLSSPYRESVPEPFRAENSLQSDQLSLLPLAEESWESTRNGDIQLWEPDVGGGVPLLTAVYNQILAPWNVVYLFVAGPLAPTIAVALSLFIAQSGVFLLARRLGLSPWGATFAAIAYVFSGSVTALILRVNQALILPWVLFGLHGSITSNDRRNRYLVVLSLGVASMWLAGFPAGALFVLYTAVAFGAYLLISRAHAKSSGWQRLVVAFREGWAAATAVVAGTAVAAFQLLPSYEFISASGALERSFTIWHRAGLVKLSTAVSGRFMGAFQDRDWWWPERGLSNPVEASSTIGAIALVMLAVLVLGLRSRRSDGEADRVLRQFFMPLGLVVLVGVYLGGPLLGLIHQLPFLGSNAFGRSRFVLALVIALAAGYGLDRMLTWDRERGRPPSGGLRIQVGVLLAAISVGFYEGLTIAARENQLGNVVVDLLIPSLAVILLAATLLLIHRAPRVPAVLAIVLLAFELQWGAWGFTPASPPETYYPTDPAFEALRAETGQNGSYRLLGLGLFDVFPPNASALEDIKEARSFYPVYGPFEDLMRLTDAGLSKRPGDPWLVLKYTDQFDPSSPALDAMAVRYLTLPLNHAPLGVTEPVPAVIEAGQLPAAFDVLVPRGPIRAVEVPVTLDGCRSGWVELRADGASSRRLAREVTADTVTFPLPDLGEPGATISFTISATACEGSVTGTSVAMYPADPDLALSVTGVEGWAVYERPSALPRVQLAEQIVRIDNATERLDRLASAREPGVVVVSDELDDRSFGGGNAVLLEDDPDRIVVRVDSDGDGFLVLRDVAAPGWKAELNGERAAIVTADHAFRGVGVPDGESLVTFTYDPDSYRWGLRISAAGLVVIIGLGWPRRRRSEGPVGHPDAAES